MKQIKPVLSFTILLFAGFFLANCHSESKQKPPVANTYVQCKSPRHQACTREYRPVCAKKDTGIRCVTTPCPSTEDVTYSNACTACADPKVFGYTPDGKCN